MIKAIFSDIDGTLLNSRHQITAETKNTIQKVMERNIPFVLVSARMPSSIFSLQQELNIHAPIICYSGALILDGNREILHNICLSKQSIKGIYDIVVDHYPSISFNLYGHDQWIVDSTQNPWVIQEADIINGSPIQRVLSSYIEEDHDTHKILCMGDPEDIERLALQIKKEVTGISIYKSKGTYLEIMDEMVSKSYAIQELEGIFDITYRESMAIGDNYNDIDMILYAGLGIAMGNAPDEVKKIADKITLSNDEDGLKMGLEKFVLSVD
jgi:Cof subfamily protein (haloacid dehalogenase superfamily)